MHKHHDLHLMVFTDERIVVRANNAILAAVAEGWPSLLKSLEDVDESLKPKLFIRPARPLVMSSAVLS